VASEAARVVAGVDVGSECVKVVLLDEEKKIRGRAVVPTRGYFEACVEEVLGLALDEAGCAREGLAAIYATGFGASCARDARGRVSSASCHARGAFHHKACAMTIIDLGGREPRAIRVDSEGQRQDVRGVRKCAVGIGSFLIFAARHLDVHPTRMQELAASAKLPAVISSYCSVFSSNELLERLREGATREDVALGCMRSIAERIMEVGDLEDPLVVTGGVPEYFPGVLRELAEMSKKEVIAAPDPIYTGALGAALAALAYRGD